MNHTSRYRLCAVVSLLIAFLIVNTITEAARLGRFPRFPKKTSVQEETAATTTPQLLTISPDEAKKQLGELAALVKTGYGKIADSDLKRSKQLLIDETNALIKALNRQSDKEAAADWKTALKLSELERTLESESPDKTVLEAVQDALYSDKEGVRWTLFDALRSALHRYQTVEKLLKDDSYDKQFVNVCDNLIQFIDKYNDNRSPQYSVALSDTAAWLDDISIAEPRAAKLAALSRAAFSGVNLQLQVGNDFVKAGFERPVHETLEIDDNILGTKVVGNGTIDGQSTAALTQSQKEAVIKVLVNTDLETHTDGSHPPVTLKTKTTGTLKAEKVIRLSDKNVSAEPAQTKADLTAEISDVKISAGALVKRIAKGRIDEQKGESAAAAEKRAEKRMNKRIDEQIDPKIEELNKRYQEIREPLIKAGLFPKIWNLSSSEEKIDWSLLIATLNQPSAPKTSPVLKQNYGLAVQVHQSALNNLAATLLAGRFIDEDKSKKQLEKYFKKLPKFLERKTDDAPAKVSFGQKAPIDVLFVDDKIKVVVRLDDIEVLNSADKSYIITVEYQVGVEQRDGEDIVVLNQTVAEAFPSTFKKDGNARLSTVQTVIRSYLMKRLEVLPKRIESKPLELEGEWEGKGSLVPMFAASNNGWLTLAWNWLPKK